MSSTTSARAHWSSRWAFILVTAGSAIGLGNIWKFPYMVGQSGGAAFVLVYLACIALIGVPTVTSTSQREQGFLEALEEYPDLKLVANAGDGMQREDWYASRRAAGDLPALLDYRRQAPAGAQAHPSEEHLLPFHVALGAGGENARTTRFHAGIDDCVIAMDAYAFEQGEPQ